MTPTGRVVDAAALLRRGVLGLVGLGLLGTAVELLFLRHWDGAIQASVWPALVVLAATTAWVAFAASRRAVLVARAVARAIAVYAGIGISFHVSENLAAGPLDRDYAATWDTLPAVDQLWLAATGTMGPAPTLAPGVLFELAAGLLLATVAHPATRVATALDPSAVDVRPTRGSVTMGQM